MFVRADQKTHLEIAAMLLTGDTTKVNIKYQGPKDMALFHLLLIFENPNGFEM